MSRAPASDAQTLADLVPGIDDPAIGRRLLAFGSSNTELTWHNSGALSWFAWVSCCARARWRHLLCVEAGICGNTVVDLHDRFERDVAPIRPHAVIVTIGGNDAMRLPLADYRAGMARLIARIRALGAAPIVQTYYCPLFEGDALEQWARYMAAAVEVAHEHGARALDPFPAWRRAYAAHPREYRAWMHDDMHLDPLGHALFGARCARELGLGDPQWPAALGERVAAAQRLFT